MDSLLEAAEIEEEWLAMNSPALKEETDQGAGEEGEQGKGVGRIL